MPEEIPINIHLKKYKKILYVDCIIIHYNLNIQMYSNIYVDKQFVLESARLILKKNNCKFNDEFCVKLNGPAMGTIFAPTYAMLSMGYFELTFYRICINEFGETLGQSILVNWRRFRGDCETPLDKTKIDPNRLLEIANSINPSIKFTMEKSNKELPFLDILIKRDDDKTRIDIYLNQQELVGVSHFRPASETL